MIRRYAFLLITMSMAVSCDSGQTDNSGETADTTAMNETDNQQKGEWITLFDGENTDAWHRWGGGSLGEAWKVTDNGTLHLDTADAAYANGGGGDIVTNEEFEDFQLQLEWKISENGNSGIMFYAVEDTAMYEYPWQSAPEMQVLHDEGHPDGKIEKHLAGDLYDLISSQEKAAKGPGEWNKAEIISMNGELEFRLNGTTTVQTTMWDDEWKEMIANSKFADMKGFGTHKKGRIVLQDHDDNVWFRNIRIRRL